MDGCLDCSLVIKHVGIMLSLLQLAVHWVPTRQCKNTEILLGGRVIITGVIQKLGRIHCCILNHEGVAFGYVLWSNAT